MLQYSSSKQIAIEEFETPYGKGLDKENRWIKLSKILPWDEMVSIYAKSMSIGQGRRAIDPRIVIGSIIIKYRNRLSDEETLEQIRENMYMQYFLGLSRYTNKKVFDSSLFVTIRRRMGEDKFNDLNDIIITRYEKVIQGMERKSGTKVKVGVKRERNDNTEHAKPQVTKNVSEDETKKEESDSIQKRGKLIVDATVAPADIKYPTDLDLINSGREETEKLIDKLYKPEKGKIKPRTYRQKAREEYLNVIKQRKKSIKTVRKAIRKQLGYLNRNIKTIDKLLDKKPGEKLLSPKELHILRVLHELFRQQEYMYKNKCNSIPDRIVSIYQPQVRPIVRGKSAAMVEFGAKVSISLVNGFAKPHKISWDAYNEGGDLISQVENYNLQYGYYPAIVIADKIYGTKENRDYLKRKEIRYSGKKLGRPKSNLDETDKKEEKEMKQLNKERNQVEGKFGLGKRSYGLDKIKAKKSDTSVSWISAIFFVMNVAVFWKNIFLSLFQLLYIFKNTTIKSREMYQKNIAFYVS